MNWITSGDLPQADRLESVLATIIAVSNGNRTDIEIANQVPGIEGDDRQGRYYRAAAVMLGFLNNENNYASLTVKGEELVNNPSLNNPLFINAILNLKVYQRLIPYMELHSEGLTREEVLLYLTSISDPRMGDSMLPRRISTILAWPRTLGFINFEDEKYFLINNFNNTVPMLEVQELEQPLLPRTGNLEEYTTVHERVQLADREISIMKNQVAQERALNSHRRLVNLVADKIRGSEGVPRYNQLIDLASKFDEDYIFEMKSTNEQNTKPQIRKGLSQLYEYRYLQSSPNANLVLVVEQPLNQNDQWIQDYLEIDRKIHLVWDGDDELYASEHTIQQLPFLHLRRP